jgi:hypothetical protein
VLPQRLDQRGGGHLAAAVAKACRAAQGTANGACAACTTKPNTAARHSFLRRVVYRKRRQAGGTHPQ